MDLQTLRNTLRQILFDQAEPSASRWNDADLNRFINEALLEIARISRRIKKQDFLLPAGTDSITLPEDCLKIETVLGRDASTGSTAWNTISISETPYPLDSGGYSRPLYWPLDNSIVIRPIPDMDHEILLVYFYKFPQLENDTDTPEPTYADGAIIAYSMWQALDYDGSPLAQVWQQKFVQQLTAWGMAEMRLHRRRPAQVQVIR